MIEPVVKAGDRIRSLEALRDRLARDLDGTFGKDAVAIAKELRLVLGELDRLNAPVAGDGGGTVADITARIAERRQKAAS